MKAGIRIDRFFFLVVVDPFVVIVVEE